MELNGGTAVLFTAAFLMPGFVWSAVLSMFLPRKAKQADNRFLEFFTLSCINNFMADQISVVEFFRNAGEING